MSADSDSERLKKAVEEIEVLLRAQPKSFPPSDASQPQAANPHPNPQPHSQTSAMFQCVACKVELRVPLQPGSCRCPKCKTPYIIREVHTAPSAFIIVPQIPIPSTSVPQERPTRKAVTPAVKAALALLGLDESSDLQLARQAYRKLIQLYHPDKVSHLGLELKNVAEVKTKELNEAINTIMAFYSPE